MADNTFVNVGGYKVSVGKKYSTSEVKTGDVWIDGKPIYRKTFSTTTINSSTGTYRKTYTASLDLSGNSVDTFIAIRDASMTVNVQNVRTIQYMINSAGFSDNSSNSVQLVGSCNFDTITKVVGISIISTVLSGTPFIVDAYSAMCTVYYTKTTD